MNAPNRLKTLGLACLVVLLLFCFVSPSAVLAAAVWGEEQEIQATENGSYNSAVAMDGLNAVTVWFQNNPGNTRVRAYSRYSSDGGKTWSTAQTIDSEAMGVIIHTYKPSLVMSGLHVLAVWSQQNTNNRVSVMANYSSDGGVTWQNPLVIQDGDSGQAFNPQAAMDGQNAVAVWVRYTTVLVEEQTVYSSTIYNSYSANYGADWSTAQAIENIDFSSNSVLYPRIAIDGSNVVAVWEKYTADNVLHIYSNYSSDGGAGWNTFTELSDHNAHYPQIAVSGTHAMAVWLAEDYSIYGRYSGDCGATWNPQIELDAGGYNVFMNSPGLAMAGDNAVAVWAQFDGSNFRVYRNYSSSGGAAWSGPGLIENNVGFSGVSVSVGLSGLKVCAVWIHNDREIFSNSSEDGGNTWGKDVLIGDNNPEDPDCPWTAVSNSGAVAVWNELAGSNVHSNYAYYQYVRPDASAGGEVAGITNMFIVLPCLAAGLVGLAGAGFFFRRRRTGSN